MRQGHNPAKRFEPLPGYGRHRVIVPIYLPNLDGYFTHALDVLRLCLESLHLTTGNRAAVTVVSNGCAPQVVDELQRCFDQGWFDALVLNHTNRGKVDAIAAAARGCFEPFITLSDGDVLFRQGWLEAVDQVFGAFPEAGFVCPFPAPSLMWHHTTASMLGGLWRGELRFEKVADELGLERLDRSFGSSDFTPPELRRAQLVVKRKGQIACIGATHIVCTLRREVLMAMPSEPSLSAIARGSEEKWFDETADRLGWWRLSTPDAWASHMGNDPEPWMARELSALAADCEGRPTTGTSALPPDGGRPGWARVVPLWLRQKFVRQLRRDSARRALFRRLGYPMVAAP